MHEKGFLGDAQNGNLSSDQTSGFELVNGVLYRVFSFNGFLAQGHAALQMTMCNGN